MTNSLKSTLAGIASGVATCYVTTYLVAVTAAIAFPSDWPSSVWLIFVVFGLGAFLPAAVIHLTTLLLSKANALIALTSFCVSFIGTAALTVGLTYAGSAISAAVIGSIMATAMKGALWSNNSFKPTPLRGAA